MTTALDGVTGGLQRGQMAAVALPGRKAAGPKPKLEIQQVIRVDKTQNVVTKLVKQTRGKATAVI